MMQMKSTPLHRTRWGMTQPGYNNYKAPSKVVTIPVHFVSSESTRTGSATKIQKVVRGFLVRNTMRKISGMRVELERIEREISVEVLRREQRERVRVVETIMNLLLKLDSVRVLHYPGLRECRKSLIKKAIALQEMVDQIGVIDSEKEGECVGEENCLKDEEAEKNQEVDKEKEEEEGMCMEEECLGFGSSLVEEKDCEEGEGIEGLRNEEDCEGEEIEGLRNEEDCEGEEIEAMVGENCLVKDEEGDCEGGRDEGKDKRELLEKMVEDNEKMMEMMAQLFQRNEIQTRLLTSLIQRVEHLERAFACEKLRKKKKRNGGAKNRQSDPRNGFIGF
ncbi:uncharacterized protein LOC109812378 [Cajanus cajan]|uniref:BAG domain-containing protein n=1 Tax=Cajanus cajan TaxID=3821 RepID=A0A151S7I8_CAJCA|nr:uncharacterized protein LOC109812378 [Cajanus cajan]KYP50728.1 hypothetical protein KK1_027416 [Cajanus cajan]